MAQYILQMHIRTASNYRSSETEKNFCRLYVCTAIPPSTSYRFRTIACQLREIVQWLSDFATWNLSLKLMQEQWYPLFLKKDPIANKCIRLGTIHILRQQRTWWVGVENCQFCFQYCIYPHLTPQVGTWVRKSPKLFWLNMLMVPYEYKTCKV